MDNKMYRDVVSALTTLHDKHQRWPGFFDIEHALTDRQFWKLFIEIWSRNESGSVYKENIHRLAQERAGHRPQLAWVGMEADDRKVFDDLPDTLTIYRGARGEDPLSSWSFTLSKEKALWFAERQVTVQPVLVTATAEKTNVLFFTGHGYEDEVVVFPALITDTEYEYLAPVSEAAQSKLKLLLFVQQGGFEVGNWYMPGRIRLQSMTEDGGMNWAQAEKHLQSVQEGLIELRRLGFDTLADKAEGLVDVSTQAITSRDASLLCDPDWETEAT